MLHYQLRGAISAELVDVESVSHMQCSCLRHGPVGVEPDRLVTTLVAMILQHKFEMTVSFRFILIVLRERKIWLRKL